MRQFSNPTHVSLGVVLQIRRGALRAFWDGQARIG